MMTVAVWLRVATVLLLAVSVTPSLADTSSRPVFSMSEIQNGASDGVAESALATQAFNWNTVAPVSAAVADHMQNVTIRTGCPVPVAKLAQVSVVHTDFEGEVRRGMSIVHKDSAFQIAQAFTSILQSNFHIDMIRPMYVYGGDDIASMRDNYSSHSTAVPTLPVRSTFQNMRSAKLSISIQD